jgi:bleomycin hydrolase
VVLEVPDNWEHNRFLNIPADSLLAHTERAVRQHHGVCWEGDISERGFSFEEGIADLSLINGRTTDDHCMSIVGIAHNQEGKRFFILKNSWGTDNPYGGLMYMSFDYFKAKTIAVYLTKEAFLSSR